MNWENESIGDYVLCIEEIDDQKQYVIHNTETDVREYYTTHLFKAWKYLYDSIVQVPGWRGAVKEEYMKQTANVMLPDADIVLPGGPAYGPQ